MKKFIFYITPFSFLTQKTTNNSENTLKKILNITNQAIEYTLNAANKSTCIGDSTENLSDGTNKAVDDGSEVSNNGIDDILKVASNTSLKSWFHLIWNFNHTTCPTTPFRALRIADWSVFNEA